MQEIGRAGRSGRKSSAVMYYNNSDIAKKKKILMTPSENIVPVQLFVSAKYY